MNNKVKHSNSSQRIPDMEFKPLLRGESPYYGNLNRAPQSAFDLANTVAEVVSWGGTISILQPANQTHEFKLYDIGKIGDNEVLFPASVTDSDNARFGIVIAEAEVDSLTGVSKNIVVCTFCPNFIMPFQPDWYDGPVSKLYLTVDANVSTLSYAAPLPEHTNIATKPLAIRTGPSSMFFSGTVRLFNSWSA